MTGLSDSFYALLPTCVFEILTCSLLFYCSHLGVLSFSTLHSSQPEKPSEKYMHTFPVFSYSGVSLC